MFRSAVPFSLLFVSGAICLAALVSCLLVVFFGTAPAWSPDRRTDTRLSKTNAQREKLVKPVNLEKGIDPNTPLKDALEFLSERADLSIIIDTKAFSTIGVEKVEEQPVQLPRMTGANAGTILRLLLGQIKGETHYGTFVIRGDHIEVTTSYHTGPAMWSPEGRHLAPVVDVNCDHQPLDETLRDLSDSTGVNIVVDSRVERQARTEVTAHLHLVVLDAAVRLLADMAGLRVVILDNVLYVTSKENAKEVEAEEERVTKKLRETGTTNNPLLGDGK